MVVYTIYTPSPLTKRGQNNGQNINYLLYESTTDSRQYLSFEVFKHGAKVAGTGMPVQLIKYL